MAIDRSGVCGDMTDRSPDLAKLHDIANRLQADQKVIEKRLNGQTPDDHRDAASLMLNFRAAELALAAADDFHFDRPVAGAVIGRAILETAIVLRWCMTSDQNATRWWNEGDAAIQKTLRTIRVSNDPAVVALRVAKAVGIGLPGIQQMAAEGGIHGPYTSWYHTLSAYAHAGRMSTGHAYSPSGAAPLPPLVLPCIYFATDVGTVFSTWWNKREVPPPWPHP